VAREDMVVMRRKELTRLHVVQKVIQGDLAQVDAARMLGVSDRQVRRWVRRVEREGEAGVIHRSRGERSNRAYTETLKQRVVTVYRRRYGDFGPTLFVEKLEEREGIELGRETVRRWLVEAGAWAGARQRQRHHRWRERKRYAGEMVQIDGSHHDWLEGRGPKLVLMSHVDDATGRVLARFYEYEGTMPAMESFRRYVRAFGLPVSVYLDNHTTYKSPAEPTLEERLAGRRPKSEFERALEELGVEVIHAHSPQARGRVERTFRTFQDRLVKEMRLSGITTMEAANAFLETYLPVYNRRFAREAAGDVHRARPASNDLDRVLSIQTLRRVRNDGTVMHRCTFYEILEPVRPKSVLIEERLDGSLVISHRGRRLKYQRVDGPKPRVAPSQAVRRTRAQARPAPSTHPWKKHHAVPRQP
jgi:transposase